MYKKILASFLFVFVLAAFVGGDEVHTTSFVAFPADCNSNPPMVFGGKLLSEMDRCAAITVRRRLYDSTTASDYVTVAVQNVTFYKAAEVKDLLFVTGTIVEYGSKSIKVHVSIQKELRDRTRIKIVEADYVFVAYDVATKKAVEHGLIPEKRKS